MNFNKNNEVITLKILIIDFSSIGWKVYDDLMRRRVIIIFKVLFIRKLIGLVDRATSTTDG